MLQEKIAKTLREIGSNACTKEALRIESLPTLKRRFHFRNLNLTLENLVKVLEILRQENKYKVDSLSFSYNKIGNEGVKIICEYIPKHIVEIGLVDCDISDEGAQLLLSTIQDLPDLDMLCLENNKLSKELKLEYQKFGAFNPDLLLIV